MWPGGFCVSVWCVTWRILCDVWPGGFCVMCDMVDFVSVWYVTWWILCAVCFLLARWVITGSSFLWCCLVQDGLNALGKVPCAPPRLSEVSPTLALKQFQCLSDWWWPPFREDCQVLPLSMSAAYVGLYTWVRECFDLRMWSWWTLSPLYTLHTTWELWSAVHVCCCILCTPCIPYEGYGQQFMSLLPSPLRCNISWVGLQSEAVDIVNINILFSPATVLTSYSLRPQHVGCVRCPTPAFQL